MRGIAYRVSIAELLGGEFKPSEGKYDPAFVRIGLKEVGRCNVIGTIVAENPLVLDDGTGEIKVLSFAGQYAKEGEVARVIGKVREKGGERFISAEIIKPIAPEWLELRKLELSHKTRIKEIRM